MIVVLIIKYYGSSIWNLVKYSNGGFTYLHNLHASISLKCFWGSNFSVLSWISFNIDKLKNESNLCYNFIIKMHLFDIISKIAYKIFSYL